MNDHCTPGSEWVAFTKVKVPLDRYYTSTDDAVHVNKWIALPGGHHILGGLGIGRVWHFFSVFWWMLNGLIYVTLLFTTGEWKRLVPTSWDIFPRAWETFLSSISFNMPPEAAFQPYDALQQLAYFGVVFILAPLAIVTGIAMSPAFAGRFPWYLKLLGGRQVARSIHFLVMIAFVVFLVIHVSMVVITGFAKNMNHIVLGLQDPQYQTLAVILGLLGIAFVIVVNIWATEWSNHKPRSVQKSIGAFASKLINICFYKLQSKQKYTRRDLSPYYWINGYLPTTPEWLELKEGGFAGYKLKVNGLVENPLELSLNDLRALHVQSQITKQHCIQGWSGIGEWTGVPLSLILDRCRPLPSARYVIFHSFQRDGKGIEYYTSLDLEEARYPQTILAYEFNSEPLSIAHGAPLRVRIENQLGFKMCKWIRTLEIVESYEHIGLGMGGYREDVQFYIPSAQI